MPTLRLIVAAVILSGISPMMTLSYGQVNDLHTAVSDESTPVFQDSLTGRSPVDYPEEDIWSWSLGTDFVTSYIWRGSRQGSGPHIQPFLEYSAGLFTAGAWGTTDFNGYEEADLWFAFELPGGFTLGMQDYYLPELPYFDFSSENGSHAFELNIDWESDNLWLSANCIINEAGGIGSYGRDLYFEAGFVFEQFSLFMGAGNGWHTEEGGFSICNIGLEAARDILITDRLILPVRAQLVFNPDREQLFVTAGITFSAGTGD